MRTGQTEGRRWSIWLPLLLQSFKHDAVLDAESDWRINDVGFIFLSRVRSNKNIVWLSSDSGLKKKNPRHSVSLEFLCDHKLLTFFGLKLIVIFIDFNYYNRRSWVIPRQITQFSHDPSQMFPKKLLKIPQCVLM